MKDTHKWTAGKTALIVFDCILCLAIIVSSVLIVVDRSRKKNGVVYSDGSSQVQAADATTAAPKGTTSARLMCAGDNLIHRSIYRQANERANGDGYDFEYAYKEIRDIIGLADIAFLNQETIIDPESEPDTYPTFNSPSQLLDEMIDVGFDVFNQSTNHVLDKHEEGARSDIKFFNSKQDIILTGLYESRADMLKPQTKTVNDITFSFVGFTEYLNGFRLDDGSDLGLLSLDDKRFSKEEQYETMRKMIENAKKNSDVVCVSMHWETENITEPDESQQEVMDKLMEFGADIVIGTGPHVLQPMEYRENGDGEQALIIWSLGNLISCQDRMHQLLGGIADVTVKKDLGTGKITIENASLIPTITHYNSRYGNVKIVPFRNYTDELADEHGIGRSTFNCEAIKEYYTDMFGGKLKINWE